MKTVYESEVDDTLSSFLLSQISYRGQNQEKCAYGLEEVFQEEAKKSKMGP
jgi:hypothetical protein